MSWLKIDDGFVEHPKISDLSDRAFRLHMAGLCYSARNLTDGFLSVKATKVVCALTSASRRHLVELRDAKLWKEEDDGWLLRDYLEYNPSAAEIKERRAQRSAAGRAGGIASGEARREAKGEANASANRSSKGGSTPDPGPSPTQEEPTEPVEHQSGKVHDLARLAAASRLLDTIPDTDKDEGTRAVVLAYARELDINDFDDIRESLCRKLAADELFKSAGAYVNGALQKAARKKAHAA